MIKSHFFGGDRRKLFQLDSFVNRCRWIGASPQFWDDTNPMSQNSKIYSLMQPTNQVYGTSEPQ